MKQRPPLCFIVLLVIVPVLVSAQQPAGAITGLVTDPSGARVAHAVVNVINNATHFTAERTTSGEGLYTASGLEPGSYEVRVSATGFRTATAMLQVEVGRTARADFALQVGSATDTMTVRSTSVGIDPVHSALEGVVTRELVEGLPLNGRNFLELGQLEPGVQLSSAALLSITKGAYGRLAISGQSGVTTRVTLDGLDISDEHAGSVAQNISQESIHEYQVSRSTFDAATGLTGSGAVNVATRSGSNELRGSAFFFWRDATLAARLGPQRSPFSRKQGGFNLGGSLVRDRLFWFGSYERNHQVASVVTTIPQFPRFNASWRSPFEERMANARVDWNVKPNVRTFARFTHNWNDIIPPGTLGGGRLSPLENSSRANQFAVGLDISKGRFLHSFRFGHLAYNNVYDNGQRLVPELPITLDPAGQLLTVSFNQGQTNIGIVGPFNNQPGRRYHHTNELRYDGGATWGAHALRWGADLNVIRVNWFEAISSVAPGITVQANASCSDNPLACQVSGVSIGNGLGFWSEKACLGLPHGCIPNNRLHWYAADSWRIARALQVNYGVRWVYEPGPDNSDLIKPALQDAFLPGGGGRNPARLNNFAPQLGIVWSPNDKWAIRAGSGIYYDTNLLKHVIFERNQALPPGITQAFSGFVVRDPLTGATLADLSKWKNQQLGTVGLIGAVWAAEHAFQQAYQTAYAKFPATSLTRCELDRAGCTTFASDYHTPYSFQLNAGVQRELRHNLVLSLDYVRNRGLHQLQRLDRNRLGAAETLDIQKATAAITATNIARGCAAGGAGIDCAIIRGARIGDYAAKGLGFMTIAAPAPSTQNLSAFPGRDATLNRMNMFATGGITTYNALQVKVQGALPDLRPVLSEWKIVASYALSQFTEAGTFDDPAFVDFTEAFASDQPLSFRGPGALDRTHMLTVANLFALPGGVRLNSIWRAFSSLPQTLFVPTSDNAQADIFLSDFNGDGFAGDPLPGTNRGSYGRDLGCGANAINRVIDRYNHTQAGQFTPAGRALVATGLLTFDQMRALGAVSPVVAPAPDAQVCLDSFITTDLRITRPFRLRHERITIEPALEWFNVFNIANYDLPDNKLRGTLSSTVGSLNGTPPEQRPNRAGYIGGNFALGTPRSWQLGLRISF